MFCSIFNLNKVFHLQKWPGIRSPRGQSFYDPLKLTWIIDKFPSTRCNFHLFLSHILVYLHFYLLRIFTHEQWTVLKRCMFFLALLVYILTMDTRDAYFSRPRYWSVKTNRQADKKTDKQTVDGKVICMCQTTYVADINVCLKPLTMFGNRNNKRYALKSNVYRQTEKQTRMGSRWQTRADWYTDSTMPGNDPPYNSECKAQFFVLDKQLHIHKENRSRLLKQIKLAITFI